MHAASGNDFLQHQVGRRESIGISQRAHCYVLGGPRSDPGDLHELSAHQLAIDSGAEVELAVGDGTRQSLERRDSSRREANAIEWNSPPSQVRSERRGSAKRPCSRTLASP